MVFDVLPVKKMPIKKNEGEDEYAGIKNQIKLRWLVLSFQF